MGEFVVVAAAEMHPRRELPREAGEELLVLRLPAAEDHEVQRPLPQDLRQRLVHELEALLRGEAAHHAGQRDRAHRIEAEPGHERAL